MPLWTTQRQHSSSKPQSLREVYSHVYAVPYFIWSFVNATTSLPVELQGGRGKQFAVTATLPAPVALR